MYLSHDGIKYHHFFTLYKSCKCSSLEFRSLLKSVSSWPPSLVIYMIIHIIMTSDETEVIKIPAFWDSFVFFGCWFKYLNQNYFKIGSRKEIPKRQIPWYRNRWDWSIPIVVKRLCNGNLLSWNHLVHYDVVSKLIKLQNLTSNC